MRIHWLVVSVLVGCAAGRDAPSGGDRPGGGRPSSDPTRAILEADIIQLSGTTLYAMSRAGSLSVIDVGRPEALTLLGRHEIGGEPFEMYLRDGKLIAMTDDVYGDSSVTVLDVADPAAIARVSAAFLPGKLADSRLAGAVLYVATYKDAPPFTAVTTLDTTELRQLDQLTFESTAPDAYNLPWGSHWTRSIVVAGDRMYVGGHADIAPDDDVTREGIIDVVDISDRGGALRQVARLEVAGAILSRWQLDERDQVLRVISQRGAGRQGNSPHAPLVETFRISGDTFTRLGVGAIELPRPEGLRTVRFDRDRAYAITYYQTDPLFVIDLADPAAPRQRGELHMPGFMFHLEPQGDRLLGLGIDRTDPGGSLNVSLFDVADPDAPRMLSRVPFATPFVGEDYAILNGEVAEDQDRIQKAFRMLDDGLVVVPFSALDSASCDNAGGGVQLVQRQGDRLLKGALLPVPGNPRRAIPFHELLIAVSDSHVGAYTRSGGRLSGVAIDVCVPRDITGDWGGANPPPPDDWGGDDDLHEGYGGCSSGGGAGGPCLLFALALILRRRHSS